MVRVGVVVLTVFLSGCGLLPTNATKKIYFPETVYGWVNVDLPIAQALKPFLEEEGLYRVTDASKEWPCGRTVCKLYRDNLFAGGATKYIQIVYWKLPRNEEGDDEVGKFIEHTRASTMPENSEIVYSRAGVTKNDSLYYYFKTRTKERSILSIISHTYGVGVLVNYWPLEDSKNPRQGETHMLNLIYKVRFPATSGNTGT
ncbi:MAG: hypothetical protein HON18_13635 [Rhodospirillaceae bacterium]|jgi:hypothetical protein|nr:hypothetical protein [Rhodospirillaceae bacterium]MBT6243393.1 hypothetical protein [Rhodospirillaceae bacterium]